MRERSRFIRFAVVAAIVLLAAACGGGDDDDLAVTARVVDDPATPGLHVVAPDDAGPWPVVVALHGLDGTGEDMVELGTRLARGGVVVFAPTYRTDLSTAEGLTQATDDIVCSYRTVLDRAAEHGGDLSRPVTVVGWSLGADFAVLGALGPEGDGAAGRCPGELPIPETVVAIAGCYDEFEGRPVTWFDDLTGWGNKDADVHLVDGEDDETCPAAQTERLASDLRAAGYDVDVTRLEDANHPAPIFHDVRDGEWVVLDDDPAGEETVTLVLDAIADASG